MKYGLFTNSICFQIQQCTCEGTWKSILKKGVTIVFNIWNVIEYCFYQLDFLNFRHPVLKNINFAIPPGKTFALVSFGFRMYICDNFHIGYIYTVRKVTFRLCWNICKQKYTGKFTKTCLGELLPWRKIPSVNRKRNLHKWGPSCTQMPTHAFVLIVLILTVIFMA